MASNTVYLSVTPTLRSPDPNSLPGSRLIYPTVYLKLILEILMAFQTLHLKKTFLFAFPPLIICFCPVLLSQQNGSKVAHTKCLGIIFDAFACLSISNSSASLFEATSKIHADSLPSTSPGTILFLVFSISCLYY